MIMLRGTRTNTQAIMPKLATSQAACWDVSACLVDGDRIQVYNVWNEYSTRIVNQGMITLFGGERALVPTGWIFDIPATHSLRLHPRSGLAWKQGITLANAQGVIDSDYTQETYVLLYNSTEVQHVISHGDRISQMELVPVCEFDFQAQQHAPDVKGNRLGGFGSTGVTT